MTISIDTVMEIWVEELFSAGTQVKDRKILRPGDHPAEVCSALKEISRIERLAAEWPYDPWSPNAPKYILAYSGNRPYIVARMHATNYAVFLNN